MTVPPAVGNVPSNVSFIRSSLCDFGVHAGNGRQPTVKPNQSGMVVDIHWVRPKIVFYTFVDGVEPIFDRQWCQMFLYVLPNNGSLKVKTMQPCLGKTKTVLPVSKLKCWVSGDVGSGVLSNDVCKLCHYLATKEME
jgi:hypothetical protein